MAFQLPPLSSSFSAAALIGGSSSNVCCSGSDTVSTPKMTLTSPPSQIPDTIITHPASPRIPSLRLYQAPPFNSLEHPAYIPLGEPPSFIPFPGMGLDPLKPNGITDIWRNLPPGPPIYPYDAATIGHYPYPYGGIELANGIRRKNATRETTSTLKAWLYEHRKNPYPTKGEKIMLAIITKMTLTQVSTWFANARRRLKKENKMTWTPRNRSGVIDAGDDSHSDTMDHSDSIQDNMCDSDVDISVDDLDFDADNIRESEVIAEAKNNNIEASSSQKSKIWSLADTAASADNHSKYRQQEDNVSGVGTSDAMVTTSVSNLDPTQPGLSQGQSLLGGPPPPLSLSLWHRMAASLHCGRIPVPIFPVASQPPMNLGLNLDSSISQSRVNPTQPLNLQGIQLHQLGPCNPPSGSKLQTH